MQEYLSQTLYHFAGTVFQRFASLLTRHDSHAFMPILFYSVSSNLQALTGSRKASALEHWSRTGWRWVFTGAASYDRDLLECAARSIFAQNSCDTPMWVHKGSKTCSTELHKGVWCVVMVAEVVTRDCLSHFERDPSSFTTFLTHVQTGFQGGLVYLQEFLTQRLFLFCGHMRIPSRKIMAT